MKVSSLLLLVLIFQGCQGDDLPPAEKTNAITYPNVTNPPNYLPPYPQQLGHQQVDSSCHVFSGSPASLKISVNGQQQNEFLVPGNMESVWTLTASVYGQHNCQLVVYRVDPDPTGANYRVDNNESASLRVVWRPPFQGQTSGTLRAHVRNMTACQQMMSANCNEFRTPVSGADATTMVNWRLNHAGGLMQNNMMAQSSNLSTMGAVLGGLSGLLQGGGIASGLLGALAGANGMMMMGINGGGIMPHILPHHNPFMNSHMNIGIMQNHCIDYYTPNQCNSVIGCGWYQYQCMPSGLTQGLGATSCHNIYYSLQCRLMSNCVWYLNRCQDNHLVQLGHLNQLGHLGQLGHHNQLGHLGQLGHHNQLGHLGHLGHQNQLGQQTSCNYYNSLECNRVFGCHLQGNQCVAYNTSMGALGQTQVLCRTATSPQRCESMATCRWNGYECKDVTSLGFNMHTSCGWLDYQSVCNSAANCEWRYGQCQGI